MNKPKKHPQLGSGETQTPSKGQHTGLEVATLTEAPGTPKPNKRSSRHNGNQLRAQNPEKYNTIVSAIKDGFPLWAVAYAHNTSKSLVQSVREQLVLSGELSNETIDQYIDRDLKALAMELLKQTRKHKVQNVQQGSIAIGVVLDKIASRAGRPTSIIEHRHQKDAEAAEREFIEAIEVEADFQSDGQEPKPQQKEPEPDFGANSGATSDPGQVRESRTCEGAGDPGQVRESRTCEGAGGVPEAEARPACDGSGPGQNFNKRWVQAQKEGVRNE